ncbi:MAG: IS256 family transposase [Acetobacteraceae bacterium]
MSKQYQRKAPDAIGEGVIVERVAVTLGQIAVNASEGLLALATDAGLQVMAAMMAADVEALCGPKGKHNPDRVAYRHAMEDGSVSLGGRRVPVRRPRVRAADGSGEVPIPTYETFADPAVLSGLAMQKMLAGLSCRGYAPAGLEPVGRQVQQAASATSKSAVSRRFVTATSKALGELLSVDLRDLDLVVLMIDGVYFAEHLCIVALGIDIEGRKHPLALVAGSTENTTTVKDLLVGLRERGLDVTRPVLAVLDGSKALAAGVREIFDSPVIARCQVHKIRNVADKLPKRLRSVVKARMQAAYAADSVIDAESKLGVLAAELDKSHPAAAGSLREGLSETLTVLRLDIPPALARSLRSTNAVESMISIARTHSRNVKNWKDTDMTLRWCAAGMLEAKQQFRRIKGHMHLPKLQAKLAEATTKNVSPPSYTDNRTAA